MASRRQYATIAQLEEFADITVTDNAEAEDQISMAEEMVDAYVGPQDKHIGFVQRGKATGGSTTTLVDTSGDSPFGDVQDGYWTHCEIELLSGSSKGEKRFVSGYVSSTRTLTVSSAFSTPVSSGIAYRISQLAKFPRHCDVEYIQDEDGAAYYKTIPDAVSRAVVAQVKYIIDKGADFFSDGADFKSESLMDYSYTRGDGAQSAKMISPHARMLLRGLVNRRGNLIA